MSKYLKSPPKLCKQPNWLVIIFQVDLNRYYWSCSTDAFKVSPITAFKKIKIYNLPWERSPGAHDSASAGELALEHWGHECRTELFSPFHSGFGDCRQPTAVRSRPKCAQELDHRALLASPVRLSAQCRICRRERVYQTPAGHVTHPCWCWLLTDVILPSYFESNTCESTRDRKGAFRLSLNVSD